MVDLGFVMISVMQMGKDGKKTKVEYFDEHQLEVVDSVKARVVVIGRDGPINDPPSRSIPTSR